MPPVILAIPVRILTRSAGSITVLPADSIADCPQCAAGQGCGQNPWFRGLLGQAPLTLPCPADFPDTQTGELTLPTAILTRLTLLAYALPLAIFLTALALTQALPPWLAFGLAISAAAGSSWMARHIAKQLINQHIRLRRIG